ncbi:MAG TPA: hypothetical protein PLT66_04455, partial [Bacillota bacterium]|nr:hypothetical protein [Bacillota bacterium]
MQHKLKGSFIQNWYCKGFDDKRWEREFAEMKKCGMDMLIIGEADFALTKRIISQAAANDC